jgi:hypothetical protein
MGDFFKTVTSGLGRYVFAWLLPSAVAVGVLLVLVEPSSSGSSPIGWAVTRGSSGRLPPGLVLGFVVMTLAVVSGYMSTALYRLCEGYHLPTFVKRRMFRHHTREWWRIHGGRSDDSIVTAKSGLNVELRWRYPERKSDIMPTKLGNALRGAETYGRNRWNLDTLTVWHELIAVTPPALAKELDDARSGLDFFMSAIVHLTIVATVSVLSVAGSTDYVPIVVAMVATLAIWPSYAAAVHRVGEYRSALQAQINLGRAPLAAGLGYELPPDLVRERFMWANLSMFLRDGQVSRGRKADRYRIK